MNCAQEIRPPAKAILLGTYGRETTINIASGQPQKPMQCRRRSEQKVYRPQKPRCGCAKRKSEKAGFSQVEAKHVERQALRRIGDLGNQSGTIGSMVETPAMLLRTITTIALLSLALGNIIPLQKTNNVGLFHSFQHSIMEHNMQPELR